MRTGKATVLGVASRIVAGLVAATPVSGFIGPMSALIISVFVRAICYGAVILKGRIGYDDSLDVFGVDGVGTTLGAIPTGVFASTVRNAAGGNGLLSGNVHLLMIQLLSVAATAGYAVVAPWQYLRLSI